MRVVVLCLLAGCSLYFDAPTKSHQVPPDAAEGPPDGGRYCYSNVFGVIMSPANEETGVPTPTVIQSHIDDYAGPVDYAKYMFLFDSHKNPLNLPPDPACSHADGYWSYSCFDLQPDTTYHFEVGYFCYSDPQHLYPVAQTTFRTAPP